MTAAISVTGLCKSYGSTVAVDDLSFEVARGEVVAILGPNGAGKTTTVEILEGHRDRDAGQVSVLGADPQTGGRAFRERIGIVLQSAGIDPDFSVREVVSLYRSFYPRRRDVDEVINLVGLHDKRDDRVKTLSGGQQRRVDLALGLVGDPELLFLDEPTTGFDPSARRSAWELIEDLRSLGTTILLTTHYMDEAQYLADRVMVVANGRLVAEGTPDELGERGGATATISFRARADLVELPRIGSNTHTSGGRVQITTSAPTADLQRLTAWAVEHNLELGALELTRPSLEDTYLALIAQPEAA